MRGVDGNFDLAELDRIDTLLRQKGKVSEWAFAYNTNKTPPAAWSDKIEQINAGLPKNLKVIQVVPAGAF